MYTFEGLTTENSEAKANKEEREEKTNTQSLGCSNANPNEVPAEVISDAEH